MPAPAPMKDLGFDQCSASCYPVYRLKMKTTGYFTNSVRKIVALMLGLRIFLVMARRPYLRQEWIELVLANPVCTVVQANGRIRLWALIPELGKYLRVVTEPDGETVHNAFLDRRFRP